VFAHRFMKQGPHELVHPHRSNSMLSCLVQNVLVFILCCFARLSDLLAWKLLHAPHTILPWRWWSIPIGPKHFWGLQVEGTCSYPCLIFWMIKATKRSKLHKTFSYIFSTEQNIYLELYHTALYPQSPSFLLLRIMYLSSARLLPASISLFIRWLMFVVFIWFMFSVLKGLVENNTRQPSFVQLSNRENGLISLDSYEQTLLGCSRYCLEHKFERNVLHCTLELLQKDEP
jgi:hypothetical protein